MNSPQPDSNAARAVLFVDVDGTLVPGVSSAVFLAARLGHADQVAEAEAAGFHDCSGPTLKVRDGIFTGTALGSCDEYGKRDFAKRVAGLHGLSLEQCAAIGDSRSDLPLFGEVGLAVAFNADPGARALAHAQVDSNDLSDAIPALERWLAANYGRGRPWAAPRPADQRPGS